MPTKTQLLQQLAELERENHLLRQDKAFGGLTRPALEIEHRKRADECQYVVFADLNKIHELNEEIGQDQVDDRIRGAFSFAIREGDLVVFGRWKSGDEEAFLVRGDPEGFMHRLHENLNNHGLSAISAYARIENNDLPAAVDVAYQQVKNAKAARGESSRRT